MRKSKKKSSLGGLAKAVGNAALTALLVCLAESGEFFDSSILRLNL